ncbi:Fe3+-siderophore ABC transporter permease [Ammoniphilus oxalaticus]|uniref:Fe3+-siderophore ABC transporter permease n=1 Tax=Ammoniphilus oxalaticus TaxID=66863 RepID=A0A419SNI5_9BACL|nr:iron ABC transporter permease [Ammoniphilus oxalaticus]RKD25845.1 Fe3+-siderophore ABC transporter permease [Ammoniphilus oxalaticus]
MDRLDSKISFKFSVMIVLLLMLAMASFAIGRYPIPPDLVLGIMFSKFIHVQQTWSDTMETVIFNVRIPRIIAAIVVGGVLSVAGAAFQNLTKNPMAAPDILGVSAGAGFGAAMAMTLSFPWFGIQLSAFLFSLLAVGLAIGISRIFGKNSIVVLILGGLVISAFFQALISLLKYIADPEDTLPAITFWLMGGLSKVSNQDMTIALIPISISLLALFVIRWQVNVLSVGDEEAKALGVKIRAVRMIVILCATLMTAAAVSISGVVGWIGLVIPHMARMIVGSNFYYLLPASFLIGGSFLLLVDNVSRSASSIEIPLGILTALIGTPFFVFLLSKIKKGWT